MDINIDKNAHIPVYLQIRNEIRSKILDGSLPAGTKLPPERKLASMLNLNRSTILNAYRELKADGYIEARIGQGTAVCAGKSKLPSEKTDIRAASPIIWRQLFSQSSLRSRDTITRDVIELANRKDVISFAAGVAVPGMDSIEILSELMQKLLIENGQSILQLTPTEGLYSLRESIRELMGYRGTVVSVDEITVLSGSQQGIDLTARTLIEPGDYVVVEEPTFFCALQIFNAAGARVVGVPIDEHGIRTDILENMLERYRPKLIYTMPTFQNPSGIVMSSERRLELLELAYRYKTPILEDDAYGELRYEGEYIPPLKSLDKQGNVIYLSTFSKILFPGFRIGWMAAPKQLIQQIANAKQLADIHSSSLPQWICDAFLRSGYYKGHIGTVKKENCLRRNEMLNELEISKINGLYWNRPEGGLYIWCKIPDNIDLGRLAARAAANGVAFVPGDVFYPGGYEKSHIRLNFTYPRLAHIRQGIRLLLQSISQELGEAKKIDGIYTEIRPLV